MTKTKKVILSVIALVVGILFWSIASTRSTLSPESYNPIVSKILSPPKPSDGLLASIKLPPGFSISYFAKDVPGARSMTMSESGTVVYVGTRDKTLYAVTDSDQSGEAESVIKIATNLDTPNGVAWRNGDLYVAEISRIIKYEGIDQTYTSKPSYEVVYDSLPTNTHHGWRYIKFGPDGMLYIAIGAPCNICQDQDLYGRIIRLDPSNMDSFEVYAYGIRNSVGFDWSPFDGSLWFTDNGRDKLGDDLPPDELNRAGDKGFHFGFPYCHGGSILDPVFGIGKLCSSYEGPTLQLGPHVAALGMHFYNGRMFPPEYRDKIFIAEHGSWNRTVPIGYRITTVDVDGGTASNYLDFATGWLDSEEEVSGRPVDLLELHDGSLLISDDQAGAIYRLSYNSPN